MGGSFNSFPFFFLACANLFPINLGIISFWKYNSLGNSNLYYYTIALLGHILPCYLAPFFSWSPFQMHPLLPSFLKAPLPDPAGQLLFGSLVKPLWLRLIWSMLLQLLSPLDLSPHYFSHPQGNINPSHDMHRHCFA